jgi:hypothetical protein
MAPSPGRGFVHGLHHGFILVGAGHGQDIGKPRADHVGLVAHAPGHDHAAILGNRLADRGQAFLLGRSRKPQVLTSTTSAPA